MEKSIKPFTIAVAESVLIDLKKRLAYIRWPDEIKDAGWDYGVNLAYMKELVSYWEHKYDWKKQESMLNSFSHFKTEIDGTTIHFIHKPSNSMHPIPLILTHGWPSSFYEMTKLIPLLTDAFDIVIPSLPGFGFSDRPTKQGMGVSTVAELWLRLMTEVLGYKHFAAAGEDWGAVVTREIAITHPKALVGMHLTYLGYPDLHSDRSTLSKEENDYLDKMQQWSMQEGAYAILQSTKPQTVTYGLNDSPVGLAAWIIEKFRSWSDCDGDIEKAFSKDELLTNIMIYWVTETIGSSARIYFENMRNKPIKESKVPTGVALFPKDNVLPPQAWAERTLRIKQWTEMPRGGHFAAMEQPELLANDIKSFFHSL